MVNNIPMSPLEFTQKKKKEKWPSDSLRLIIKASTIRCHMFLAERKRKRKNKQTNWKIRSLTRISHRQISRPIRNIREEL